MFLYLSHQARLRRWMETSRIAQRLSRRFVAGESLSDALAVGRRIGSEGITITLDHLGENVTSLDEAANSRDAYLRTLAAMSEACIECNVSLKLTQFGMDLSEDACRANVARVVSKAEELGGFVRVDMESSEYTDRTLRLVRDLHEKAPHVGTVIQSYLHRSEADIRMLCGHGIRVRLCKGAYLEPPSVAFPHKADVDRNYIHLMQILLAEGTYPAIATHDVRMIDATREYAAAHSVPSDRFEFQMLYGIRRDLQRELVRQGYRLRLYVPFGKAWYPYFMRRLAERPANVLFLLRNLLRK